MKSGRRLDEFAYRRILEGLFDRRIPAGSFISQNALMGLLDLPILPLSDPAAETALAYHVQAAFQRLPGMV